MHPKCITRTWQTHCKCSTNVACDFMETYTIPFFPETALKQVVSYGYFTCLSDDHVHLH